MTYKAADRDHRIHAPITGAGHKDTDYDYTQAGAYFITICTRDRNFGKWSTESITKRAVGESVWLQTATVRPYDWTPMFMPIISTPSFYA